MDTPTGSTNKENKPSAITWLGPTWNRGMFPTPEGRTFIQQVYGWMCLEMIINAAVAYLTYALAAIVPFQLFIVTGTILVFCIVLLGILTMNWIPKHAYYFSNTKAALIFFAYSTLNGFILSFLCSAFHSALAIQIFLITAGLFAIMEIIGYFGKADPTTIRRFALIAPLDLAIVIVTNIMTGSIPGVFFFVSVWTLAFLIFTLLCSPKLQKPINGALMLCVNIYWLLSLLGSVLGGNRSEYAPPSLWVGPQEKMSDDDSTPTPRANTHQTGSDIVY